MSITAAIVIIGNEILSGRTEDKNTSFIASRLGECGIKLLEVRIIPDDRASIISTLRELSPKYSYIFTTGGIGPTHDDITTEAVAAAFDLKYERHQDAFDILKNFYEERDIEFNKARTKMAYMPSGSTLLGNDITTIPGFTVKNVYVLAGIPHVMHAMFEALIPKLKRGKAVLTKSLDLVAAEGAIAEAFEALQAKYPSIEMGSYPYVTPSGQHATSLVLRGSEEELLSKAYKELQDIISITHD